MSKVLIFSDLHVHAHKRSSERLQDCLDTLDWVFKTAIDRGIEDVLFLGDLFHDRQKIDVLTYQRTFEIFEKYLVGMAKPVDEYERINEDKPPFNLYLLLGNHDLWHLNKWDVSSVNPFRALNGVTVIDKPSTLSIGGELISFMPFTHDPIKDLKEIDKKHSNILCGHIALHNAKLNVMHGVRSQVSIEHDGDMTLVDASIFKDWDQVFLGHYHAEQQVSANVEYIGSPLQLSFGEAFQHKHILIYDLETKEKEYIRNKFSPQHFIIHEKDKDKYPLKGNFIRLEVDDITESYIVQMRNELVEEKKVGTLEITQVEKESEELFIEDAKAILLKEDEMLEKYVEQVEKTIGLDLDKQKLLKIGRMICESDEN